MEYTMAMGRIEKVAIEAAVNSAIKMLSVAEIKDPTIAQIVLATRSIDLLAIYKALLIELANPNEL
jgi:hypothetical protein